MGLLLRRLQVFPGLSFSAASLFLKIAFQRLFTLRMQLLHDTNVKLTPVLIRITMPAIEATSTTSDAVKTELA